VGVPIIYPTDYGADPFGKEDSTTAFYAALKVSSKTNRKWWKTNNRLSGKRWEKEVGKDVGKEGGKKFGRRGGNEEREKKTMWNGNGKGCFIELEIISFFLPFFFLFFFFFVLIYFIAMKVLLSQRGSNHTLAEDIIDLGGAVLDLGGGDYLISSPIVIPQLYLLLSFSFLFFSFFFYI
jgi:hypothetical protein